MSHASNNNGDRSNIDMATMTMATSILVVLLIITYIGLEAYILAKDGQRDDGDRGTLSRTDRELVTLNSDQMLNLQGVHVVRKADPKSSLEIVTQEKAGVPIDQAIQTFLQKVNGQ